MCWFSNDLWTWSHQIDWNCLGLLPRQLVSQTCHIVAPQQPSGQVIFCSVWVELEEIRFHTLKICLFMLKSKCVSCSLFDPQMDLVKHTGGCHCGAVRFEVWSSPDLHVFHCRYVYDNISYRKYCKFKSQSSWRHFLTVFFPHSCSVCTKKQNHHFIVPGNHFRLLQVNRKLNPAKKKEKLKAFHVIYWCFLFPFFQGSEHLTTYTFNTHVAKHTFCKTCGVQSFYTPRSNPDGYGMTLYFRHMTVTCAVNVLHHCPHWLSCLL